ncbi:hypothetical protein GCM10010124_33170 [Pilimelia terevasa]|uniref:Lipoprotein n=1 Tax=Pilimelia terevasa TaxID=53372 RepID=A0A8J3FLS9_9ACTN|nr:hypothetical protein [Pilimelia terevasa]GGK37729.1 hypothetical protein GCM10010124_33170 [Pilimelia terevasa]
MAVRILAVLGAVLLLLGGCGGRVPPLAGHRFAAGFLGDKAAVIQLSTQAYETRQHGRVVFVGQDGAARVYRTGGLDMGRLAAHARESVQVSEAASDTVVGAQAGTYARGGQAIGFFAAWLPTVGYVTVFNGGRAAGSGGYRFDVGWRAGGRQRGGTVDRYLLAAGDCGDEVFALAETHGPDGRPGADLSLLRLRFGGTLDVDTVARWPRTPATAGTVMGRLFCAAGGVHFWYETTAGAAQALVASVDPRRGTAAHRVVRRYADRDEQQESAAWHVDRATHLHAGRLYHVDGQGRITAVTVATGAVRRDVVLPMPPYQVGMALTYWSGNRLHVLHQPADLGQPATLTTYDADAGTSLRQLQIKGLGALVEEGAALGDLLVLP